MSEGPNAVQDEADEEADTAEATPAPPNRRRRILLIVAAFLLVAGVAGGGWFMFGRAPADALAEAPPETPPETFVDVPPIQVALRAADGSSRMLKLHVMLVPGSLEPEELTARLPLLLDRFQPFLRELRPEDMSGSAATFRVKEELLIRANQALGAGAVRDVLIQDLMQA